MLPDSASPPSTATSLQIAQQAQPQPIEQIALRAGLEPDEIELYGRYKAKVSLSVLDRLRERPDGKLVCVTSITPTSAGEGKTTTLIGLAQGLAKIGVDALACLREPSIGPVFGIKGGAAGGGHSQVIPMEDINLHFTGDMHAISAANNLLAAMLDASLQHGNPLRLDLARITWRRAIDMNDRALRHVTIGQGRAVDGVERETGFDITAACEVMALLAVSRDLHDLRERLGAITVGYDTDGDPVTAEALGAAGAMTVLLKEAVKPNLVQTLEGQPCLMHCGPFANIAHGNNSLIADRVALKLADVVVTESGFGSDMGFEKLLDIVCPAGGLTPSAAVLVVSAGSVKHHGGDATATGEDAVAAIERGMANVRRHLGIVETFGLPCVVAINRRPGDTRRGTRAAAGTVSGGGRGRRAGQRRVPTRRRRDDRPGARGHGRLRGTDPLRPALRAGRLAAEQAAQHRPARLRRRRRPPGTRSGAKAGAVRGPGTRPAAGVRRQDAAVAVGRPEARRRAGGLHAHRPRRPRLHRRGLAGRPLRRRAADARPGPEASALNIDIDADGHTVGLF